MIILTGYGLALVEWGQAPRSASGTLRRPAIVWGCAAIGLALTLLVLRGGLDAALLFWLFQCLGLAFIVRMGASWALACGASPFRLFGRGWSAWPLRALAIRLGFMLLLTALIQPLASAGSDNELARRLGLESFSPWRLGLYVVGILSLAPIVEESFFRHYLLYRIESRLGSGPWAAAIAVVLSSLAWSLGHVGLIDPWWLRWIHIFLLGLVLGDTARRHGLDAAIALHWLFNLTLVPLILVGQNL